ncbi:hypothetical protein [Streptomyces hokutonensis]|uniref:hypothetical protein n=1 Tax=Streptomyces hokutonensis TaxID=1306990 RepID=UPI00037FFA58|nr:hypothetical protein [Streptomyces hokutonensis]
MAEPFVETPVSRGNRLATDAAFAPAVPEGHPLSAPATALLQVAGKLHEPGS